jgi:hypothetical protein
MKLDRIRTAMFTLVDVQLEVDLYGQNPGGPERAVLVELMKGARSLHRQLQRALRAEPKSSPKRARRLVAKTKCRRRPKP